MNIRRYVQSDYSDVCRWWHMREQVPMPPDSLSGTGLIVSGVAAGWLYRTDSSMGMYHGVTTNPGAPSLARHQALDAIFLGLEQEARVIGIRLLLNFSSEPSIVERALRLGAKSAAGSFVAFVKELT